MNEIFSNLGAANPIDRRSLLRRAGIGGAALVAGGLLAGCGGSDSDNNNNSGGGSSSSNPSDVDVLNFALNLEYLESAYYTIGVNESLVPETDATGSGTPGAVTGGRQASNLGSFLPYFREIASDESNHVRALRAAIVARGGIPIARPAINLGAIAVAAQAAGLAGFDPFADANSFLLGGFFLSDVGVTAYVGGSQFLDNSAAKLTAAQLLAVEAYHVGSIRSLINVAGSDTINKSIVLSGARDALDGTTDDDQGAGPGSDPSDSGFPNIALTFPTGSVSTTVPTAGLPNGGLAFPRTFSQVLALVYNSGAQGQASGGLFPAGVNGRFTTITALP